MSDQKLNFLILDGISGVPLGLEIAEALEELGHTSIHFDCLKQRTRTFYGLRSALSKALDRHAHRDGFYCLPRLDESALATLIARSQPDVILVIGFIYKFFSPTALRRLADRQGARLLLASLVGAGVNLVGGGTIRHRQVMEAMPDAEQAPAGGCSTVDLDAGQAEAARSLGLSQWQAMRKVVFPQGIKNAIPALTNELIINIKDSSVLSVIGVFDLMYATTTVAGVYYRQMEVYCVALVVYLILTLVASRLLEAFGKKLGAEAPVTLPSSN